ncbi:hypothetical protein MN1_380 [Thermus phage MN1]|nr:hypothetical protein MN1_380 [Thermus phage MN1]
MVLRFDRGLQGELDELIAGGVLHLGRVGKREWALVIDGGDSQYVLYLVGGVVLGDVEGATVE